MNGDCSKSAAREDESHTAEKLYTALVKYVGARKGHDGQVVLELL